MIKIGILTCIHSNDVCARVGCLNAFYDRKNFFADYPEDARLTALFTCNGCEEERPQPPKEDKGILEKNRTIKERTGFCCSCRNMQAERRWDRMRKNYSDNLYARTRRNQGVFRNP